MSSPVNNIDDFIDQVSQEMGDMASQISNDAFERVSNKTNNELQWDYPITDSFKAYWFIERGKRHLIEIFLIESARKFKYKQINLNQRFDHYLALIKFMDEQFLQAIEDNPEAFPAPTGGVESFPDYIANTFRYNFLGEELT